MKRLLAALLVAAVVGDVVWQRPAAPVPPPAPPKNVVFQYADGSRMWSSGDGQPRSPLVTRVFAEPVFGKDVSDQLTARLKENPACNGVACTPSAYRSPTEPGKTLHAWMVGYTPQLAVTVLVKEQSVRWEEQAGAPIDADLPRVVWQEFLAEQAG